MGDYWLLDLQHQEVMVQEEAEANHNIETEGHIFEIYLVDLAMTVLAC